MDILSIPKRDISVSLRDETAHSRARFGPRLMPSIESTDRSAAGTSTRGCHNKWEGTDPEARHRRNSIPLGAAVQMTPTTVRPAAEKEPSRDAFIQNGWADHIRCGTHPRLDSGSHIPTPGPALAETTTNTYVSIETAQTQVYESGLCSLTVKRSGGSLSGTLTVRVRTWEANNGGDDPGQNDSELYHDVTFNRWHNTATVNVIAVQDLRYDPILEPQNPQPHGLRAEVLEAQDGSYNVGSPAATSMGIVDVNEPPSPSPTFT